MPSHLSEWDARLHGVTQQENTKLCLLVTILGLALFDGVLCDTSKPVVFPLLFWLPLLSYSSKALPLFNFVASHIYVCDLIVAHVATFFFFKTDSLHLILQLSEVLKSLKTCEGEAGRF